MSPIRCLVPALRFSRNTHQIQLLGRPGCHLCDEALAALVPVFGRKAIEVIDITTVTELEDLYVFRIPVVLYQNQVICEGIIDRNEARSAMKKVRNVASGRMASK